MEYPAIPKVPYLISYTRLSVEARDGSQLGNIEAQHKTNTSIPTDLPIIHLSDYGGHRSGRSTNHRPAYRYSLRLVEDDANCRGLIVYMQDRLARDVVDTGLFVKICERLGKNLVVPLEGIDTFRTGWTTDTKMLIHIKAAFAEAYSSGVGDRIRNKVGNLREHLVPWGTPPFGYVRVGKSIAAVLRPNSDAPAAVRCLELFAGGLSYGKTLESLNGAAVIFSSRAGLPCRWSLEAVRTVIGNAPFYAGHYIGRKGWDAKASTLAVKSWPEYLRAIEAVRSPHIEPIIDEALAVAIFERRKRWMHTGRVNTGMIPLLTSLGFVNGRPLRKQPRPYGVFYTIPGGGFHKQVDEIDAAIVARLAGVQFPPEMRAEILRQVQMRTDSSRAASLRAYADELRKRQGVLLDLLMADRIDRGAYDARYDEAAAELRRVEGELMAPAECEIAMSRLADALGTLQLMTAEKRRTNLRRIFRRVDLAESGEIERLHLHDWARQAFAGLENQTTDLTSVGWNYAEGGNVEQNSILPAWVWFVAVCGIIRRKVNRNG